jgi:hypothetical protein
MFVVGRLAAHPAKASAIANPPNIKTHLIAHPKLPDFTIYSATGASLVVAVV